VTTRTVFTVGLTGGIGSGKSTVAALFSERGATVIDADEISHRMTAPGTVGAKAIITAFGADIADGSGRIDRAKLRARVFASSADRATLEGILHPRIRAEMVAQRAAASEAPYVIWMVPLLTESAQSRAECDRIAVVDCSTETQITRVQTRSQLARREIERIIAAQATRETRRMIADDVIENDGDVTALMPQIEHLDRLYRRLSTAKAAGSA
jgi:dephospho-CoA kinase